MSFMINPKKPSGILTVSEVEQVEKREDYNPSVVAKENLSQDLAP